MRRLALAVAIAASLHAGAASAQVEEAEAAAEASQETVEPSRAPARRAAAERGPRGGVIAVRILQVQSGQAAIFATAPRRRDIQVNPFNPESLRTFFEEP